MGINPLSSAASSPGSFGLTASEGSCLPPSPLETGRSHAAPGVQRSYSHHHHKPEVAGFYTERYTASPEIPGDSPHGVLPYPSGKPPFYTRQVPPRATSTAGIDSPVRITESPLPSPWASSAPSEQPSLPLSSQDSALDEARSRLRIGSQQAPAPCSMPSAESGPPLGLGNLIQISGRSAAKSQGAVSESRETTVEQSPPPSAPITPVTPAPRRHGPGAPPRVAQPPLSQLSLSTIFAELRRPDLSSLNRLQFFAELDRRTFQPVTEELPPQDLSIRQELFVELLKLAYETAVIPLPTTGSAGPMVETLARKTAQEKIKQFLLNSAHWIMAPENGAAGRTIFLTFLENTVYYPNVPNALKMGIILDLSSLRCSSQLPLSIRTQIGGAFERIATRFTEICPPPFLTLLTLLRRRDPVRQPTPEIDTPAPSSPDPFSRIHSRSDPLVFTPTIFLSPAGSQLGSSMGSDLPTPLLRGESLIVAHLPPTMGRAETVPDPLGRLTESATVLSAADSAGDAVREARDCPR